MTRPSVDRQLERLLVLVPWVMSQEEGPTVEVVCERFGITERELISNLELLFMCGLYPFTPDTLIEADIVDGRVWIRSADAFVRPPFFKPAEALALVGAASAVLDLPGNENNDALRRALTKLTDVLGVSERADLDVELARTEPATLDGMKHAVDEHRVVEVDYFSNGRGEWSHRRLMPLRVFNSAGQWYSQALPDGGVANHQTFRLDRMRALKVLEESFVPPSELPPARTYEPRSYDPVVVLDLEKEGRWVAEQYPTISVDNLEDGRIRVELAVSATAWLERLLLRLGRHAKVVTGDVDVAGPAQKILCRYSATISHQSAIDKDAS